MKGVSIRTRLTAGYVAVLAVATLTLAIGAWWLLRNSTHDAADASLRARLEGTRRFIDATLHELPPEELLDEFQEFANLTSGSTLLEVTEDNGRTLCRPSLAAWDALRTSLASSPEDVVVERQVDGEPYRALSTLLVVGGQRYHVTTSIAMATEYEALTRFGWLLSALVPAVMLIAAAGGFWLSGRALAPVDRMTRDVQLISLGEPGRRLDVPSAGDELSRLATTFNAMLARWQQAFGEMVRFTTDASHELRTPVSLARTTADLTLARPRTVEEYRTALADVLGYTERMSRIVDDLLSLARAEAGVEPSAAAPVDLGDVAGDAVREWRPACDRRPLALTLAVPEAPVIISGSRESLRRLFVILLDNAVRYTPAGGAVHVSVSANGDGFGPSAVIAVADSGPGIAAVDRPRVFDPFYRGADARAVSPDGSGLGLSIARTIVERHAGSIAVADGDGGRGCRIEVRLG